MKHRHDDGGVKTTFFSVLSSIAIQASALAEIPQTWAKVVETAATNSAELTKAWKECPESQKKGMEFLVQHMPAQDAKTLKAEYLLENVRLAYESRSEMPWGKAIPEDIFLNDVLPYAVLDESRDSWRADFKKRFTRIAADAPDAGTARQRINDAIEKELGVQYNTKRRAPNQGPEESIRLKMASCTGLSILLCDALRSVCIPCRIAGTAMWTTMEGNHNWTEVWLPETQRWMFTEYNPDSKGLDHGWVIPEAARGIPGSLYHGIFATSWAPAPNQKKPTHFPMVWNFRDTSVPAVDVSQRYIDLGSHLIPKTGECELRIDAVTRSADGTEVREPKKVMLRQADVIVTQGVTPTNTADRNEYLVFKVKQGQRYQLQLLNDAGLPIEEKLIAPTAKEAQLRVKLGGK